MFVSRTFAKRRIARGERPGWFAAWGLVLADSLLLIPVLGVIGIGATRFAFTNSFPQWALVAMLVAVLFIPMQYILIMSAKWAAQSRWEEKSDQGAP